MEQTLLSLKVFWEFFKIGLFAVGGGPATIPFLFNLSNKTGWFTSQELTNMLAISESTPGPIGVNTATYVGFKILGLFGGFISTVGLVLPSIIVIVLIAKFLSNFSENKYVKRAFWGIRPVVTGLIISAAIGIWKASLVLESETESGFSIAWGSVAVCFAAIILMRVPRLKKLHPACWLFGAAVVGIVFRL